MNAGLVLFWASILVIVYTYLGFPLLLFLRNLLLPRPYRKADVTPRVSMIISVHNEGARIEAKLKNILALDYPRELFEAVIVSDGSDDDTNAILARTADQEQAIRFLPRRRQGKAAALNAAVKAASGEVLVFSDANSIYALDAIRMLVRPFADSGVGGVAGNQRYLAKVEGAGNAGEKGYWSFDRLLKTWESRAGNTISATGAIYAIRRSLFEEVPGGVTDDFVTSTRVIASGFRLVFEPGAVAYEPVSKSQAKEFARKVRVMTRGLRAVVEMRELFNPLRHGFYAVQLLTHKVLRRLIYVPLVILFAVNPFLLDKGWFYQLTWLAQMAFYGLALLTWLLARAGARVPKLLSVPAYFCMVYAAAMLATWNLLRGHRIEQWTPEHATTEQA